MEFQKKFLFIDDDADDRDFFCATIQEVEPSVECFFAKDGFDAIEQLGNSQSFLPDFIFIDMNMPRMSGVECLAEIRKFDRLANSKIYIYTTAMSPKITAEAMALGATDVLIKPSTISDLTKLLRHVLIN